MSVWLLDDGAGGTWLCNPKNLDRFREGGKNVSALNSAPLYALVNIGRPQEAMIECKYLHRLLSEKCPIKIFLLLSFM